MSQIMEPTSCSSQMHKGTVIRKGSIKQFLHQSAKDVVSAFRWKNDAVPVGSNNDTPRVGLNLGSVAEEYFKQPAHPDYLQNVRNDPETQNDIQFFELEYMETVKDDLRHSSSQQWTMNGAGLGLICLLGYGPISMLVGMIVGGVCGFASSVANDVMKSKKREDAAREQKKKIENLMRWTSYYFGRSEDPIQLFLKVVLEYEHLAAIGAFSKTARSELMKLYKFLCRPDVEVCVSLYLDYFVNHWRDMNKIDITMCRVACEICVECCNHLQIPRKPQIVTRITALLENPTIAAVFATTDDLETMRQERTLKRVEQIIYADEEFGQSDVYDEPEEEPVEEFDYGAGVVGDPFLTERRLTADVKPTLSEAAHSIASGGVPQSRRTETVVEPKKLFKSLSDMINFDPDLKHRTPISSYEMEFLMLMEKSSNTGADGWDVCCDTKNVSVFKKLSHGCPVVLVKAFAQLIGIPPNVITHHIRHIQTRLKWDNTFSDFRLIDANIEENEVIYCVIKAPFPIANRDFVQWRRTEQDPETNQVMIFHRSASHPKMPERSGVIRAETLISGYVIRPLPEDENSCYLFILAQTDVKGIIPRWLVNTGATRAPMGWIESLKGACSKYMEVHGRETPNYADLIRE